MMEPIVDVGTNSPNQLSSWANFAKIIMKYVSPKLMWKL